MTEDFELTDRARAFIYGLRGNYSGRPLTEINAPEIPVALEAGAFKIL